MGSGVRVPSPPPSESRGGLSEPLLTSADIDTIVSRLVCIKKASIVSVLFDNRIGKFPKIEINFSGCFGSSKDDSGIREN